MARARSRVPRPCCGRSTASGRTALPCRRSPNCATTARRRAGAGSTAGATPGGEPDDTSPARREQSWVAPEWGWAWPANRRMLYNRASADPDGRPWSERKAYVWWDADQGRWTGHDVPDFAATKSPDYRPPAEGATGPTALRGTTRSSCRPTARAGCTCPSGCSTGRCRRTTSRRSRRSRNPLYGQQANPAMQAVKRPAPFNPARRAELPLRRDDRIGSPSTTPPGGMTRWCRRPTSENISGCSSPRSADRAAQPGGGVVLGEPVRGDDEGSCGRRVERRQRRSTPLHRRVGLLAVSGCERRLLWLVVRRQRPVAQARRGRTASPCRRPA